EHTTVPCDGEWAMAVALLVGIFPGFFLICFRLKILVVNRKELTLQNAITKKQITHIQWK
ncbi:MAG: hypothetical protein ACI309_00235, partial [Candidatus Limisoma sp.]